MAKRKLYPITRLSNMLRFTAAGYAKITLESKKSGTILSYLITDPNRLNKIRNLPIEGKDRRLVYLILGKKMKKDGIRYNYIKQYIGWIHIKDNQMISKQTPVYEKQIVAFVWYWNQIINPRKANLKDVIVYHEGRCGKCRKPLTHPASTKTGLGPGCANAKAHLWYKETTKKKTTKEATKPSTTPAIERAKAHLETCKAEVVAAERNLREIIEAHEKKGQE